MKLDIGCGSMKAGEDYIGVDVIDEGCDVLADARCLPFKDEVFDEVYSNACLGVEVNGFDEALRVLKAGGIMSIKAYDDGVYKQMTESGLTVYTVETVAEKKEE